MSSLFHKLFERHADSGKSSLQPRIPSRFEATHVRSESNAIDQGLTPEIQVRSTVSTPVVQAQRPIQMDPTANEQNASDSLSTIATIDSDVAPNWQRRLIDAENALKGLESSPSRDTLQPPSLAPYTAAVALPSLNRQPSGVVETVHSHHHHYDPVPDASLERPSPRIAFSDESTERKPPQNHGSPFEPLDADPATAPIVQVNVAHSSDSTKPPPRQTHSEFNAPPRAATTPTPSIEPIVANRENRPSVAKETVLDFEREYLTPKQHADAWQPPRPETRPPRLFAEAVSLPQKHAASPTIVTDVTPKQPEPSTTVHVSIGRILVRSSTPKTETTRQPASSAVSRVMTLDQYARHRAGGNR